MFINQRPTLVIPLNKSGDQAYS
jgi:hypothetical protein